MAQNFSEKRKAILNEYKKTIENYSVVKKDVSKTRANLDFIEVKMDESLDKLDKATKLFKALPEEQVTNPSPVLGSFIASGSELAGSIYAHSKYYKDSYHRVKEETDLLIGTAAVADSSFNTMLNVSSSAAKVVVLQYPPIEELLRELDLPSPHEKRKELEAELEKIDYRLANTFWGAWQTIRDASKQDRYRQAAHSMRDLLSQFLDILAPPEEVKKATWYVPEHNSKKPTRGQRVKYAIMGGMTEKTLDEKDLKLINDLMNDTRKVYGDLSRLHSIEEGFFNLAESYMERCEVVIRSILELRKGFFSR